MHLKTLRRSPRLLLALDQCRLIYKPVHSLLWAFSVFSGDVEWSKRWQHEVYNDLTCHVAVYLCGPQRTTPIWINEVEARWAATQLVGLTGRLVNGCKRVGQKSVSRPRISPRSDSSRLDESWIHKTYLNVWTLCCIIEVNDVHALAFFFMLIMAPTSWTSVLHTNRFTSRNILNIFTEIHTNRGLCLWQWLSF